MMKELEGLKQLTSPSVSKSQKFALPSTKYGRLGSTMINFKSPGGSKYRNMVDDMKIANTEASSQILSLRSRSEAMIKSPDSFYFNQKLKSESKLEAESARKSKPAGNRP